MSFASHREVIEEGDTAILYLGPVNLHAIKVVKQIKNKRGEFVENVFQTTYGALKVASLIGVKFGSKIDLTRGWAYILAPSPELWTLTLPHRTQIIYTPDISLILFNLELRPGSHVVESGTGSGSLTHALARAVRPGGRVSSFDFHASRCSVAEAEFSEHGLSDVVTVSQRDVVTSGFGLSGGERADAIFLDLPHPWLVIPHALVAFKESGGRFSSFSPCVEQVQKTCRHLEEAGFIEITTLECLQRDLIISSRTLPILPLDQKSGETKKMFTCASYPQQVPGHTGYLTFATLPPLSFRRPAVIRETAVPVETGMEATEAPGIVLEESAMPGEAIVAVEFAGDPMTGVTELGVEAMTAGSAEFGVEVTEVAEFGVEATEAAEFGVEARNDAGKAGEEEMTDGAEFGEEAMTDAVKFGVKEITDAEEVGVDTVKSVTDTVGKE